MVSCRICIEQVKNPASLPCGHIFCTNCIVKTIRAVKHFTNFHPCPICRSIYNIAPVNLKMVPPNLRPFITPGIRRLYIEPQSLDEQEGNDTSIPSTSSEISRLQAENHAMRNYCVMWQRRAEIHGLTNLKLMRLAYITRDQVSRLSRERDELGRHYAQLKRKLDDDESLTRGNATSDTNLERSVNVKTESLEAPLSFVSSSSPTLLPSRHLIDEFAPPRKLMRIDSSPSRTQCAHRAVENIITWRKGVLDSMPQ